MATTSLSADPERRRRLLAAKLRALLKTQWAGIDPPEPASAAGGMTVELDGRGWALVDDAEVLRGFARALLWGLHRDVTELHVLIDHHPDLPAAARQAACFTLPVTVWAVTGAALHPVDAVPLPDEPPLDPRVQRFCGVIAAAGAEPVIEWGQLSGEVIGLPVARVCTDADGAWLEVGIGKHDRLANRMAWGDEPPADALARVVRPALEARRSGDLNHPLNQLCRERWLRAVLRHNPSLVGLTTLDPVAPPRPLGDLRVPLLAPAVGRAAAGAGLVVACSVGFDPSFVPSAAELRAARHPDTPLLLAAPSRDIHPLTRRAAAGLGLAADVHAVPDDWHRPERLPPVADPFS